MRALWGLWRGRVTNAADPEGLGRLRAQVPAVLGQLETDWAWPVTPNIRGIASLEHGDPVWIAFEGGEVRRPVWMGTWPTLTEPLEDIPSVTADLADLQATDAALSQRATDADALFWMTRVTS